ncbi:MAG: twin-arginine translocation signal domain-containing protein [Bradyrhizobiaceae bacterium]|nr:MAG: twin-arginine translocation signal domain-containing protein [Bradyrhizobiaceae bacterium]
MTIERPMFPPVDPTRRSFLQKAATLAAAGATSGVTASIALPAPAEAAPLPEVFDDRFISDEMKMIGNELDEAHDEWLECREDCEMRDRALAAWEKRYPMPDYRQPGDEGYHPTYRSDWLVRKQNVMKQLRLGAVKKQRNDLGAAYTEALHRFADLRATTPSELFYKTGYGSVFDGGQNAIAKSVLRDLWNFRTRLFPAMPA